jgi:oligopeptide transport system substrate-binding protein
MLKRFLFISLALITILSLALSVVGCAGEKASGVQELRVNLAGEPDTIDPNKASWADQITCASLCFEGLLGFTKDLELKAVVAKEIPTVGNDGISEDGKTYTFKLRSDVTWSDGEKVTAQDFEYAIKRMLSPDLAAEYASFYYDIVGAEDYNAGTGSADDVAVNAIDDTTLEIELVNIRPTFLQLMAMWPTWPTREDIITEYGSQWTEPAHYIGNGPFKLTEWTHQDHMTFEPNENYWGKKPKLDKIVLKMITDQNAELAAYKNNELDMSRVPTGSEKTIMNDETLNAQTIRYYDLTTFAFQFNVHKEPFNNKLLRQAIATGIDRASFIDNVRNGIGKPATSWIPPGMPGYDAELGSEYDFDATKAQELLAEAGYPDGDGLPTIKFSYTNSAGNQVIAEFLQGQMKTNLNINITLDGMESSAFQALVNNEQHQWAWFGWGADYPDPDNWLPDIFGTDAGNNHTTYSNPEFDTLCDEAAVELDNANRLDIYAQAQELVIDDVPIVPMFFRERFWLVKPYVKGLVTTGLDHQCPGDLFWNLVYIAD